MANNISNHDPDDDWLAVRVHIYPWPIMVLIAIILVIVILFLVKCLLLGSCPVGVKFNMFQFSIW